MRQIVDAVGEPLLPEGDIIITTGPLVGLGDHAIYSTLAKRFHELGRTVYMDRENAARNDEIMDLFWQSNPYIAGKEDRKPNAGYVRQGLFYELTNRYPLGCIGAMERAHGLPPPYSLAPYAAYQPKPFTHDISQHVLLDFSAVSSKVGEEGIAQHLRAMKGRFRNAPFLQLLPPQWASLHPPMISCESVQVDSIWQYLDMLSSCRAWVGSEAGGQSLAAMVRGEHDMYELGVRPEVVCVMTPQTYNDGGYTYRGVNYRTTNFSADRSGDYHFPHEVQQYVYERQCAASLDHMRARA